MNDTQNAEFYAVDDKVNATIRNDDFLDALLEFTLLDIRTPELLERLTTHFLSGTFFIPTETPLPLIPELPMDEVGHRIPFMRCLANGEEYLPLCPDIESVESFVEGDPYDTVVLSGEGLVHLMLNLDDIAGATLISLRLEKEVFLPTHLLKSITGISA